MTAFLWFHFVAGCIGVIANAVMVGSEGRVELTPKHFAWRLLIGIGFVIWTGVLLFGGAS